MFQYTFSKEPLKMGERDEKYGQAYWCEVNEHLEPVKFNTMSEEPITIRDKIECEERTQKRTQKGKDYYQLKKVRVLNAVEARISSPTEHNDPTTTPPTPQGANPDVGYTDQILERVIRIENKLDQLFSASTHFFGRDNTTVTPNTTQTTTASGYEKAKQARAQLDEPLPEMPEDFLGGERL